MVVFLYTLPVINALKDEIKREIKIKILKRNFSDSELISFTSSQLKNAEWLDNSEFSLDGKMYDVVKTALKNGEKIVYCLKDHRETYILPIKNIAEFFLKKKEKNLCFKQEKLRENYKFQNLFHLNSEIEFLKSNTHNKNRISFFQIFVKTDYFPSTHNPPQNYC